MNNNYGGLNASKFGVYLKKFCDKVRPRADGSRVYKYQLNDKYRKIFTDKGLVETNDDPNPTADDELSL